MVPNATLPSEDEQDSMFSKCPLIYMMKTFVCEECHVLRMNKYQRVARRTYVVVVPAPALPD
jgi:hypothetical protein